MKKNEIEQQIYNLVKYSSKGNDLSEKQILEMVDELTPRDIIYLCEKELKKKVNFCESIEVSGNYWKNKQGRLNYIIENEKLNIKLYEKSNN